MRTPEKGLDGFWLPTNQNFTFWPFIFLLKNNKDRKCTVLDILYNILVLVLAVAVTNNKNSKEPKCRKPSIVDKIDSVIPRENSLI